MMSKNIGDLNYGSLNVLVITIIVALSVIFVLISVSALIKLYKKRHFIREKLQKLPSFEYDEKYDVFYTKVDAWQKLFGYQKLYDESSKYLSMILDSEPVYFEYDDKYWLIQFWKGQYGIACGAEVGIYYHKKKQNRKNKDETIDPKSLKYKSAKNIHMIPITLRLMKGSLTLYKISSLHWWMGGFKLGEHTPPDELSLIVTLHFYNLEMCNAFIDALLEKGLGRFVSVDGNAVTFEFIKPASQKGERFYRKHELAALQKNREMCKTFNSVNYKENEAYTKKNETKIKRQKVSAFVNSLRFNVKSFPKKSDDRVL